MAPPSEANDVTQQGCSGGAGYAKMESAWLTVLRRYLIASAAAHLSWEAVHLPLYTIWREATAADLAVAVLHCTAGDLLIALASLMLSVAVIGDNRWPHARYLAVALVAIVVGLSYTVFSEWRNVTLGRWAYSEYMPIVPPLGTGLSPILQWAVIPPTLLWLSARRRDSGLPRNRSPGRTCSE
jgi:hypothetical protein